MGMSASQARLIALTARMSDTEYEAQQINQQRLTLSNQMNAVYAAMMDMEVPTPPSKIDYMETSYVGNSGGTDYKISIKDGKPTASFKVTGGDVVKKSGNQKVDAEANPAKYVKKDVEYTKSDFDKLDPAKYGEKIGADYEPLVTQKWEPWSADDIEYVTGTYDEITQNDEGEQVIKTRTLTTPCKREELPEGDQFDLSGIKTHHCEGTRPATSFEAGRTYVPSDGGAEISGDDARAHNKKADELAGKDFAVLSGGSYTAASGAIEDGTIYYEITNKSEFDKAARAVAEGATGLTVGGNPTMSIKAAEEKYGTEVISAIDSLKNSFPDTWEDFSIIVATDKDGNHTFSFCQTADLNSSLTTDESTTVWIPGKGDYWKECAEGEFDPESVCYGAGGTIESAKIDGNVVNFGATQQVNEARYEEAMQKYNNDKAVYDKEQNQLNKQTSIYQRQDKMLELKLTRLDNERNALNTEIEAVKKVIQDAVDKGFKTFSG